MGGVTPLAAAATGLAEGTPVVAGYFDVVASALDRSAIPGLLGTVAGDDTMMCFAAAGTDGDRLAAELLIDWQRLDASIRGLDQGDLA